MAAVLSVFDDGLKIGLRASCRETQTILRLVIFYRLQFIALLMVTGCYSQSDIVPGWDNVEVVEAVALTGLSATDAALSASGVAEPTVCSEGNPILTGIAGTNHPSPADFAIATAVGVGLGLTVAEFLPWAAKELGFSDDVGHWARKIWLGGWIGRESYLVADWATMQCHYRASKPGFPFSQ
jgi:hypothetical protein